MSNAQQRVEGLVVSGLIELALGASTGWLYALAITDEERVRALGIRSTARLRQWHLDLIALGGLTVAAGTALPQLPAHVKWPLGLGAWSNAMSFSMLMLKPEFETARGYRAVAGLSFVLTTTGFVGLAAEGTRRWRRAR